MTVQAEVPGDELLAWMREVTEVNAMIRAGLAEARRGRPRLSAPPLTLPERVTDPR